MIIDVIIPALDEEISIAGVLRAIPSPPVREIIVVDNGSRDRTAEVARSAGVRVISETKRGYGAACLAGLRAISPGTEVIVFMDGDGGDDPSSLPDLIKPIEEGIADMVVGSRMSGIIEPGAMTFSQKAANRIASRWLRSRFALPATDLGPFRAVRSNCLAALDMKDTDYGWTVEMQIKAALGGLRYAEVPVRYRKRSGRSKISGTVRGKLGAAIKIFGLLAWHDFLRPKV